MSIGNPVELCVKHRQKDIPENRCHSSPYLTHSDKTDVSIAT